MKKVLMSRVANALTDLAAVSDGLAMAFGCAGRTAPAVGAGVASIALRLAARVLGGDDGRPQA